MWGVLAAIALIPSPPVLVPHLAGAAAGEVAAFRDAALTAAAGLPDRWVVIGAGARGDVIGPHSRGTFAGYGVDVPVTLSPHAPDTVSALPLCALIAGWLRGQASPAASVEVRVYATDLDGAAAMAAGRALRAEIDETETPIGVLVVADGAIWAASIKFACIGGAAASAGTAVGSVAWPPPSSCAIRRTRGFLRRT